MMKKNKDGYYLIDSFSKLSEWYKLISEDKNIPTGRTRGKKQKKKSQLERDKKYGKNNNYENEG